MAVGRRVEEEGESAGSPAGDVSAGRGAGRRDRSAPIAHAGGSLDAAAHQVAHQAIVDPLSLHGGHRAGCDVGCQSAIGQSHQSVGASCPVPSEPGRRRAWVAARIRGRGAKTGLHRRTGPRGIECAVPASGSPRIERGSRIPGQYCQLGECLRIERARSIGAGAGSGATEYGLLRATDSQGRR